jgi:AraC-like DNA-binding protein
MVDTGISHLLTELGAWIIPARRVAWVPPGVRHASRASGHGRGWVVLAPPTSSRGLPQQVCVLRVSSLMRAALERLTCTESHDTPRRRLLWRVVASEMGDASPEPLEVPMPSEPRILRAVQSALDSPNIAKDLDRLSKAAGMSRRSFTRHFRQETGLSFTRWNRSVIAHHALERIASGEKVSSVAFDVGYDSVSAFIAMFRRRYGASPYAFLRKYSDR